MSRKQSYTLIVSCLLFTSLLFASIELGEGIKCYICDGSQSDCTKNLGKSQDCSSPQTNSTTPDPTTPDSTTSNSTTSNSTTPDPTTPDSTTPDSTTPDSTTPDSTTPDSTTLNSTTNSKLDLTESDSMSIDWFKELENITYECFEVHTTIKNHTSLRNEVHRGCSLKDSLTCSMFEYPDVKQTSCLIRTCETDNCNSSSMEKMGIVSLLLPLITALLRTR